MGWVVLFVVLGTASIMAIGAWYDEANSFSIIVWGITLFCVVLYFTSAGEGYTQADQERDYQECNWIWQQRMSEIDYQKYKGCEEFYDTYGREPPVCKSNIGVLQATEEKDVTLRCRSAWQDVQMTGG